MTGESAPGSCVIEVTGVASVAVAIDETTIPEGYEADPGPSVMPLLHPEVNVPIMLFPVGNFPHEDVATLEPTVDGEDAAPPAVADDGPMPLPVPLVPQLTSHLYAGSCDDVESAVSAGELNDVTTLEDDARGATTAISVASGYTMVPLAITDLLDDDHSVVVFAEDDPETMIACGAIGGVLDQDGSVSIGLAPVDDSGAAGVAYLSPSGDGSETGVSVFLVPDGLVPAPDALPAS